MSNFFFDVHTRIAAFVLVVWLLYWLLTEYLFRIEHQPRTWVHYACYLVYLPACRLENFLKATWLWKIRTAWICELPLKLLPLPLCRIAMEVQSSKGGAQ